MTIKVNTVSLRFARSLVNRGKVDKTSSWSFSAADGNKLLGENGDDWSTYEKYHLAIDTEADPETKAYYKYPIGKNGKVYRRGVIAAKSRAAAEDQNEVAEAADSILQLIDKDKQDSVIETRYDYYPWDSLEERIGASSFQTTEEGYLKGKAIITNIGVFPYLMADGSIRNELRPPEEVFDPDSLDSLKLLPLTNNHPPERVTSENIKEYQVGSLGEEVMQDQYHVGIPLVVTDKEAITDVKERNKRALSMGYDVFIEYTSGVWMGVHYDVIQRNIRYNHAAIVERGRAGDAAVMRLDSSDRRIGILNIDLFNDFKNEKKGESMPDLKVIRIDGVDYQAEPAVIQDLTRMRKDFDEYKKSTEASLEQFKKDNISLTAERDQLKEDAEKLKKDLEASKKTSPELIEKMVQDRMVVFDAAKRAGVEIKKDMTEDDVKKAVICKLYPASKEKLDKADSVYVSHRFDGALERLDEIEEENKDTNTFLKDDALSKKDKSRKDNSGSAYERMLKRNQEAWKRDEDKDDYEDEEEV